MTGGRIGERLPALAAVGDRFGHAVIGLQYEPPGAVLAEVALLVLADDKERVEDMLGLVAIEAVYVEKAGIEVGTQLPPARGSQRKGGPASPRSTALRVSTDTKCTTAPRRKAPANCRGSCFDTKGLGIQTWLDQA